MSADSIHTVIAGRPYIPYRYVNKLSAEIHRILAKPDTARASGVHSLSPADLTEAALAHRFSAANHDKLRYVSSWGAWLWWDGVRWASDDAMRVRDLARGTASAAAEEAARDPACAKFARGLGGLGTVRGIEELAKADCRHASLPGDFDTNPWLINTPGGTTDLRTGLTRPFSRDDSITKVTGAAPSQGCPIWMQFLHRIFAGNQEMVSFIQRVLGYCLTGKTNEHALFFFYGPGANGKSVLLNTFQGIMGDYAVVAPMATFAAKKAEGNSYDLAMLRGARVVISQETEEGQHWAEAKIKSVTGGDSITARYLYKDFFTYQPSFKLIAAGNHKPQLRSVDPAIRRRFNLIPFDVTIPKGDRDPALIDKLRAEWGGIIAWAIEGCLEWQRNGLAAPLSVTSATEDYLDDENIIGRFVAECCDVSKATDTVEVTRLYTGWRRWCNEVGEEDMSLRRFSPKIRSMGFARERDPQTRRMMFRGITLVK